MRQKILTLKYCKIATGNRIGIDLPGIILKL
jgi:hypothetical protein